jgi:hypothetical protein
VPPHSRLNVNIIIKIRTEAAAEIPLRFCALAWLVRRIMPRTSSALGDRLQIEVDQHRLLCVAAAAAPCRVSCTFTVIRTEAVAEIPLRFYPLSVPMPTPRRRAALPFMMP